MEHKKLQEKADNLISLLSHHRFASKKWETVRFAVEGLVKSVHTYAHKMKQNLKRTEERHQRLQPCRTPELASESWDIRFTTSPIRPIYSKLVKSLEGLSVYEPVLIDSEIAPSNKYAKYKDKI